ncbi:hypothetical protein HMI54_002942 [Coelomomyces lativittatus]|nr:hypothetical protein HMI54_002942 [Coelomomyces lativittatus]
MGCPYNLTSLDMEWYQRHQPTGLSLDDMEWFMHQLEWIQDGLHHKLQYTDLITFTNQFPTSWIPWLPSLFQHWSTQRGSPYHPITPTLRLESNLAHLPLPPPPPPPPPSSSSSGEKTLPHVVTTLASLLPSTPTRSHVTHPPLSPTSGATDPPPFPSLVGPQTPTSPSHPKSRNPPPSTSHVSPSSTSWSPSTTTTTTTPTPQPLSHPDPKTSTY